MRTTSSGFEFPLPFDPFRLLLAVLESLWWIVLVALAFGAAGASFGWFKLGDTYKAPVFLLKESAPDNWQADPGGPYIPRPLGSEALKIVADSSEVFELAGSKLEPPLSGGAMRERVLFKEIAGQDLFQASGLSKTDPQEALRYATAYAEALVEMAVERRRAEAAVARELHAGHLQQKREAAAGVSKKLLEVSSRGGVFDAPGQTSSRLQELSTLNAKLQEANNALESAKASLTVYLSQSWTAPLRAELERMKRARGAADPEVVAREMELEEIESQFPALSGAGGDAAVRALAGRLPSVVYRELMRLREDVKVEDAKVAGARQLVAEAEAKIEELPDKVLVVSDLQTNLREQLAASVLVEARMKDAEFYSKTPSPPVQMLRSPSIDDVDHRSGFSKALILGSAGLVLGGIFALVGALVVEFFRRTVRTPLQAAIATSAVPKLDYPRAAEGRRKGELRDFWLRSIGRFLPTERRFLFPVLGETRGEDAFWDDLFNALDGGIYRVVFMDFGELPLGRSSGSSALPDYDIDQPHPVSKIDPADYSVDRLVKLCVELPERHILMVRWGREPDTTLAELCRCFDRYYFITSGRDARVADVEYLGGIYRDLLGEADGVVLVDRRRPGRARRVVAALEEWFIESRKRGAQQPIVAPELGGLA